MRTATDSIIVIATTMLLFGCSTTFDVDVPDPELIKSCVEDPRESYTTTKVTATSTPFAPSKLSNVKPLNTFITNKQLGTESANVSLRDNSMLWQNLHDESLKEVFSQSSSKVLSAEERERFTTYRGAIKALVMQGNDIWGDPIHQELMATYNELVEGKSASDKELDVEGLSKYHNSLKDYALRDGWLFYAYAAYEQIDSQNLSITNQALLQKFIGGMYIHAYLKAYFRNGKFIQANWNLGNPFLTALESLPEDAKEKLEKIISKDTLVQFNEELEKLLQTYLKGEIGKIADAGFVSRGGDALAIPPVTATFDATQDKKFSISKLEPDVVGADIVRVTLEALGDAVNSIPGVSEATGVDSEILKETGNQLADAGKITIKGTNPPAVETVMANVENLSSKAHGMVSAAAGSALRGINITAMNNEAVAKILESTAGTIVRKATERIAWCWYVSIPAEENTKALSIFGQPAGWNNITVNVTY